MATVLRSDTKHDPINWDEINYFTPDLYEDYINTPQYEIEGFGSDLARHSHYWALCQELLTASNQKLGKWHEKGRNAIEAIEKIIEGTVGIFDTRTAVAGQPIPFAAAQIDERVALLSNNPPHPEIVALQESQIPYVNAINTIMTMELEANDFETIVYGCHYDNEFYNCSIIKTSVNMFERGPYGQMGRIVIEQIDPTTVFFDPKAKKLKWSYMDYLIQVHEMEYGEIKTQYPLTAKNINPQLNDLMPNPRFDMNQNQDIIQSPVPKLGRDVGIMRQKIKVYELWIKDSREKFEPLKAVGSNLKWEDRFEKDSDGYLIGDWVPRYPDGRLIVLAGGKILKDVPNPCAHGQSPFVFIQSAPRREPTSIGNAPKIMVVTRKINDVLRDVHAYAQSEIPRPMQADEGAFANNEQADNVPNGPDNITKLVKGMRFERPQPSDVPPFTFPYLQSLQNALDLISGSSAVMRGNIADGAQLSAEALSALQQYASSRLALSARYFNVGIKDLGYQLMWLVRQFYDQKITVPYMLPDGTQQTYDWKSDREIFQRNDPTEIHKLRTTEDYTVAIKAGTGKPGNQNQQGPMLELFREGLIDREAALDGMQFPNRQFVVKRMNERESQLAKDKAFGKELGVNVEDRIKQQRPGRREKS